MNTEQEKEGKNGRDRENDEDHERKRRESAWSLIFMKHVFIHRDSFQQ